MTNQANSMDLAKVKLRLEEATTKLSAEKEARVETEKRLVQAQTQLDTASATARGLQQQNQSITEALDDSSLRHTSNRQELDTRAIELAAQLKNALQARDKELQDATAETAAVIEELRQKQTLAITNAGSNQQRYQQQLSQVQSMAKTLQAHKLELAAENQTLKDEVKQLQDTARRNAAATEGSDE